MWTSRNNRTPFDILPRYQQERGDLKRQLEIVNIPLDIQSLFSPSKRETYEETTRFCALTNFEDTVRNNHEKSTFSLCKFHLCTFYQFPVDICDFCLKDNSAQVLCLKIYFQIQHVNDIYNFYLQ